MLDRVLVGNLLTTSRALGWEHRDTVYAAFEWEGEHAALLGRGYQRERRASRIAVTDSGTRS